MAADKVVIADIHGEIDKLNSLIKQLPSTSELIFLGDYINHGNDSKKVVDSLVQLATKYKTTFLIGNHETYLLQYLNQDISFYDFASAGGLATIKSYLQSEIFSDVLNKFHSSIPSTHLEFYSNLKHYYEDTDCFVSHSGINVERPLSRLLDDLTKNSNLYEQENKLDKLIICGHFPQKFDKPFLQDKLICIDTGCGKYKGKLTAIKLPERRIIQST